MIRDATGLLNELKRIHAHIRDTVVASTEQAAIETLAEAVGDDAGDTIFAIDRVSEDALLDEFRELAKRVAVCAHRRRPGRDRHDRAA